MQESVIARRYARAVFAAASARGTLDGTVGELRAFAAYYARNDDLKRLLLFPAVPVATKEGLINKALPEGVARDSLRLLLHKGRIVLLPLITAGLERLRRTHAGVIAAEVTTAIPLPASLLTELERTLERKTGKKVELTTRVDAAVIGGVKLSLGDYVIDGTLVARLSALRNKLASPGV